MLEVELKFQIPARAQAAVRKAVGTAGAVRERLQAQYLDTPEGHLARALAALRLRREGGAWVQTFKAQGSSPMERLEHEVVLPDGEAAPALDLARHANTPAADALCRALGLPAAQGDGSGAGLGVVFETDIQRTRRRVRLPQGEVELALDEGVVRAGEAHWPVCEIEFELVQGDPSALLELASQWVNKHALWLDVRSKAERGHLLAKGRWASPPDRGSLPVVRKGVRPEALVQRLVAALLSQMLANACVLADPAIPTLPEQAEYLRQWRMGVRRLRTLLQCLPLPAASGLPTQPAWGEALAELSRALGGVRDDDALAQHVLPRLVEAKAPWTQVIPEAESAREMAGAEARSPHFNLLVLQLLAYSQMPLPEAPPLACVLAGADRGPGASVVPVAVTPGVRKWLRPLLGALWEPILRSVRKLGTLDADERHRLRRRIKRLRHALEMTAGLWPTKPLERMLAVLCDAQDALGEDHDLQLAMDRFTQAASLEPRAWWAVGWLEATAAQQLDDDLQVVRRLLKAAPCWAD